MSQFDTIIKGLKAAEPKDKKQMLEFLVQVLEKNKNKFVKADISSLEEYARGEVDYLLAAIPSALTYKEKDLLFDCEDALLGIIMQIYPSPEDIDPEFFEKIKSLVETVNSLRVVEITINKMFEEERIEAAYVDRLISLLGTVSDEYQKGRVYAGLAHYGNSVSKFTKDARAKMTAYIESELERYFSMKELSDDCVTNIEFAVDVCKNFSSENTEKLLLEAIKLDNNKVSYYALVTLVVLEKNFPSEVIKVLANDLTFAAMTYELLKDHGKSELFPSELVSEEYLAKSDMVHWLTYPTELGKAPDRIEYIGKVKYLFKNEVYHVFKFMSDSDTLGDELKNKWLIGWSSNDGGTFSGFDEYELYEKNTVKKTLSNIKKKLIG